MWKVTEKIILIDLGHDYYTVKFLKEENLQKALHQGPWFINAYEAKETKSAIWIRLLELPTEFYDHLVLTKISQKLGKLVKRDVCTSEALRGRYTRICVEVPIGVPMRKKIAIGQHQQPPVYDGSSILCSTCGVLGHTILTCSSRPGKPTII
ncbi:hypothetical protein R3W88_017403 [Solanum pinnatisectum]|uniref:DUF4283 domain-containing protein n=1 Tax=Solanum pinnatisectum TaxID=50273 RepID=A0AAV9L054_9SOLN|nr:hypothetical protein R3W88_017403 [Solanum pinnatisectum]